MKVTRVADGEDHGTSLLLGEAIRGGKIGSRQQPRENRWNALQKTPLGGFEALGGRDRPFTASEKAVLHLLSRNEALRPLAPLFSIMVIDEPTRPILPH